MRTSGEKVRISDEAEHAQSVAYPHIRSVVLEVRCKGTSKSFDLVKIRAKSLEVRAKSVEIWAKCVKTFAKSLDGL